MSSIVVAHGVSLEFANGRQLFTNLHFSLDEIPTALVGPNGVGKTCLARILAGERAPTDGVVRRTVPVKLFAQRQPPPPIVVSAFLGPEYEWSLCGDRLLHGIDHDALCTTLSGGEWMRVRLARELNDDFLILDEPTNDLDRDARRCVRQFLRERKGGTLLFSHDRECLQLCHDVLELSVHGITKFGGDWLAYSHSKQRESERLGAALDRAKRERDAAFAMRAEKMSRQEKRQRRGANMAARGGEPRILLGTLKRRAQVTQGSLDAATIEQAQSAVRTAHEAFSQLKIEQVMYADLVGNAIAEQKLVAQARDFNIRRRDWLFAPDLSFTWRGNVRVAVAGGTGAGKTTLLKAILGETFETRGELRRGELETLYIDQQCSSLDEQGTVFDNVRAVSCRTDSDIRNGLARFLFSGDTVFQKVSNLSGGERLRAALARGFLSSEAPELVVLDEPTNNLDLANVEFLERLIREYRGALIVISHDETFLRNCGVEHILDLSDSTHEAVRRTHG